VRLGDVHRRVGTHGHPLAGRNLCDLALTSEPHGLNLLHRPMVNGSGSGVEGEVGSLVGDTRLLGIDENSLFNPK